MDFIYSRCARQYKKARGAEGSPGYVETKKHYSYKKACTVRMYGISQSDLPLRLNNRAIVQDKIAASIFL